jgi:2'-5' RNA ligase
VRLFVAIDPPAEALAALDAELGPTRAVAPHGLRWTRPEQWHLTLAFLGEVPDELVPGHTSAHAQKVGDAPKSLRHAGGGSFGDRVLWVGLAGDVHALRTLAESVAGAARAAGVEAEEKAFRPHLTLARAGREHADLRPAAAELAQVVGPPWDVAAVQLVHSRLGAGPGRSALHEPIATWPRASVGRG